jgi:alkylation response protein AidB-like acyl-CoA dehydrogenase
VARGSGTVSVVTSTSHYRSNLRDTLFNLFEVLDVGRKALGQGPFTALDEPTVRELLTAYDEFARERLAASFVDSDRVPLEFDGKGNVTLPPALSTSLREVYEGGWDRFGLPESIGGTGAPPSVSWAQFELTAGSNPPIAYYLFGPVIARTIDRLGTAAQRARFVMPIIEGRWGGTMVLTEPDAGSDVGAGRARARQAEDGLWEIEGVKRFITNGDYDSAKNIVHLVLARPEGAGPGTKGLSMFIVPKLWVDETGQVTSQRNGVYCTKVEKKMGIKGSATCELTFGESAPARGLLVGEVHDGIRQMFHVIEHARMAVGVKSMATLSTAYLNALAYAKERVQGADLLRAADKTAPRVTILHHPDVRRMLMAQKAFAEGMRALVLFTASIQDQVELLGGHGDPRADALDRLNDLLLPLVKGYCSDKAWELIGNGALQVFGGSGYCQDYPVEQYARDQKIDTLYEGTTHIQAQDLVFRKILRDGGATVRALLDRVRETLAAKEGGEAVAGERDKLARGLSELEGIFQAMLSKLKESPYHVGFQGNRILAAVAELLIGWLLVRQAAVAAGKVDGAIGAEAAFYTGKLAAARWYCENVLPGLTLTRKLVENGTLALLEVPEDAF